ncbi:unnamed protein product, partial [Rotaria magnacalcarata]
MVRLNIIFSYRNNLRCLGKDLGHAFDIPRPLQEHTFFAHVCLKSTDVRVNLGAEPFKGTPV